MIFLKKLKNIKKKQKMVFLNLKKKKIKKKKKIFLIKKNPFF